MKRIPYDRLEKHETSDCLFKFQPCRGCNQFFILLNLKIHEEVCDEIVIKSECCDTYFRRQEMLMHNPVLCIKEALLLSRTENNLLAAENESLRTELRRLSLRQQREDIWGFPLIRSPLEGYVALKVQEQEENEVYRPVSVRTSSNRVIQNVDLLNLSSNVSSSSRQPCTRHSMDTFKDFGMECSSCNFVLNPVYTCSRCEKDICGLCKNVV